MANIKVSCLPECLTHLPSPHVPRQRLNRFLMEPQIVSQAEYLPLRKALLEKEKGHTRAYDALTKQRQSLPAVEVTTPYTFTALDPASGEEKQVSLLDLFHGRQQLIIYHFMFAPDWDAACSSCSLVGDSVPDLRHLNARDVTFVAVSRAPIDKIAAYKKRMGWTFDWVSSSDTSFNYDFGATQDETVRPVSYNWKTKAEMAAKGQTYFMAGEQPGYSVFIAGGDKTGVGEPGKLYHTYSTYARGGEPIINTFTLLDMTPLGRQDGSSGEEGLGFKRHDEYTDEDLMGLLSRKVEVGA